LLSFSTLAALLAIILSLNLFLRPAAEQKKHLNYLTDIF